MPDILEATRSELARCDASESCDVTIVLATFNGADFLRAQLVSLFRQSGVSWRLIWRDDGSSDESVSVIEAFTRECPIRSERLCVPKQRVGVAASYHALVAHAPEDECIAFCDQDDVWLPSKLARGLAALNKVPAGVPALYCARQLLVDSDLHSLGASMRLKPGPQFPMALTQNIATGCTVMLNPAAARLLRSAPPPAGTLHDWWSYLLVSGAGGKLIVDDDPVVLYRQHGRNLVGARTTAWRRAVAALRRGPAAFMGLLRENVAALCEHQDLLSPSGRSATAEIRRALDRGTVQRLRVLWRYRLRRQNMLETALFCVWFLLG